MLVSSPLDQVCPTVINVGDRGLPLLDASPSSGNTLSAWDGSRAQGCVCFLFWPRARRQPHPQCNLQGWTVSTWHKSPKGEPLARGHKPTGLEDSPPLHLCHAPTQLARLPQPLAMNPPRLKQVIPSVGLPEGLGTCAHTGWHPAGAQLCGRASGSGPTARFSAIRFSHTPRDK